MLKIDWIRHTSLKITGKTCYGQTDIPVADSFPEEAAVVRSMLEGREYDAIYSSPLSRAALLCEACGLADRAVYDPRLMERDFGEWELKSWQEIGEMTASTPSLLDVGGHVLPPGGESVAQLLERVTNFIDDLRQERFGRVVVFCHGGVINSARYLQGDISLPQIFIDVPLYGSLTTISYAHLDAREVKQFVGTY